ncbi:unnamed protein product [Phytophthora fragariaefolia]|uniref:Unnamed protein product n=1 Tax=Phytophthora fragariaefolia TaxID=1490495 RepID=A0A9W7DAB6_9STRA|nr:unnamed protein product [Phytophthora fragariaefolia]
MLLRVNPEHAPWSTLFAVCRLVLFLVVFDFAEYSWRTNSHGVPPDTSVKVSRGKSIATVKDGQNSYNSGIITYDCPSALNGSQGYASLKDAYIVMPYTVSMKNTGANATGVANRYALGMKCNIASIVDEVKVYLNGKSIITPSECKQMWSNVLAIVELTTAEVEKHGADMHLFQMTGSQKNTTLEHSKPNTGFVRRVLNNPPEVASATTNSHGWPTLNKTTSQAIAQMRGTGAFKAGADGNVGSTIGEWFYMLKIHLVDLHPIFNEIDLVGNPQLKLELKVQTCYSDIAVVGSAAGTARAMSLTSTTLVAGSICPVMVGSANFVSATQADPMYSVIGTNTSGSTIRVAWGAIHNAITTIATAGSYYPFTQSRLLLPLYDIANPTALVSKPMKTIKYLGCYSQMIEDQAGIGMITSNKTFSVQVASSHKNVKYVWVIPFANTKSGNYATAITTPQYASPFDSAPWTCQPGSSIRDFQVQVGNKNVFQDVHSYDWMTFYDEFSKIGAVNGDLSREISNGRIGIDKWQTAQRILVADFSRISEVDVPQSIKHKSKTIREVYETDPGYCRWLMNQKGLVGYDSDIGKFLAQKFGNDDGSFLMTWGKYKHKTIKQIQAIDTNYLEWLSSNEFVKTKMPKLKTEVDELLKS